MKRLFAIILVSGLIRSSFGQTHINKYDSVLDPLFLAGKTEQLVSFLEKEIKSKPKNVDALRWLGYVHLYLTGKNDLVQKYYAEVLAITPDCASCLLNIGLSYLNQNEIKKGLEYVDRSINIDPNDGYFYCARAKVKEQLNDNTGAFMDYNKAIQLEPGNYQYYTARAKFNIKSGYYYPALSDMNKTIELCPKELLHAAYFERGDLYSNFAKYKEAIEDITKAISLNDTVSFYYFARGNVYNYMDSTDKSAKDLLKAMQLDSNDYRPLVNYTHLLIKKEELDLVCRYGPKALSTMEKMKADSALRNDFVLILEDMCDKNRASYYYHRGVAAFLNRDIAEAERLFDLTLQKFPGNYSALNSKADVYYKTGRYQSAIDVYELLIKRERKALREELRTNFRFRFTTDDTLDILIQSFNCAMHMNLAQCHTALGNFDKAMSEIDSSIDLISPVLEEKQFPFQVKGTLLLIKGKHQEAIKNFDTCIKLEPYSAVDHVNRAVAKAAKASNLKLKYVSAVRKWPLEPFYAEWIFPAKLSVNPSDQTLFAALEDCNKAIELDKKCAYAYYVRAHLRKMLKKEDSCADIAEAKKLGYPVNPEALKECGE